MTDYLHSNLDINCKELANVYDEAPLWSAPFGLALLRSIKWRKQITALDIGYGTGFPLTELAMRLGNSSHVYGIDPWQAVQPRVRQKLDCCGINNVTLLSGSAEDIPLEPRCVDLVVSNNGLNNVADWRTALSECARVLRPGGQFVQSLNCPETMSGFYSVLESVLRDAQLLAECQQMHEHIYEKRKPVQEWIDEMQARHLGVRNVKRDVFEYQFADATAFFNHFFIRLAFLDTWKALVPENRQSELFGVIESRLNEKAGPHGLHFEVPFVVIDSERQSWA